MDKKITTWEDLELDVVANAQALDIACKMISDMLAVSENNPQAQQIVFKVLRNPLYVECGNLQEYFKRIALEKIANSENDWDIK